MFTVATTVISFFQWKCLTWENVRFLFFCALLSVNKTLDYPKNLSIILYYEIISEITTYLLYFFKITINSSYDIEPAKLSFAERYPINSPFLFIIFGGLVAYSLNTL